LTREGRIKFLAAVAADDGDTTGQYKGYTHEERIQALEMLMSVEGDQMVEVPYETYDDTDEDEVCDGGCESCCGEDFEDVPSDEEVSKL
jgi:hypothetical protein